MIFTMINRFILEMSYETGVMEISKAIATSRPDKSITVERTGFYSQQTDPTSKGEIGTKSGLIHQILTDETTEAMKVFQLPESHGCKEGPAILNQENSPSQIKAAFVSALIAFHQM